MIQYEVWNDPVLHNRLILEDRKDNRYFTRYLLVARTPEGREVYIAVPACPTGGPNAGEGERREFENQVEQVRAKGPGAYRLDISTENTLLGAWGLK